MIIAILSDNICHPSGIAGTEHGLSIYFEADNHKWLVDTGASELFIRNATKLGIDISEIDYLILSHAHADHTGGLGSFLEINTKAKIYLSSNIEGNRHYSTRQGTKRDISTDSSLIIGNRHRFTAISANTRLTESVTIICDITQKFDTPLGNRTLCTNEQPDRFDHEIAVKVTTPSGNVVISSCSHMGILNTLSASEDGNKTKAYIGGTHLIDSDDSNQYETDDQIRDIARNILTKHPEMRLITGHCTGARAKEIFSEILRDKYIEFHSGFTAII